MFFIQIQYHRTYFPLVNDVKNEYQNLIIWVRKKPLPQKKTYSSCLFWRVANRAYLLAGHADFDQFYPGFDHF